MTIDFYKDEEMIGISYVKIRLRSSVILNIEIDDKFCFLWSILAKLHPSSKIHRNRVWNYRKKFKEIIIEAFDFTNGLKCSDVHKFKKLNNSFININETNLYTDEIKWKHEVIPIEVSKKDSDRVIDLLNYINHYVLNKNYIFFGGILTVIMFEEAVWILIPVKMYWLNTNNSVVNKI